MQASRKSTRKNNSDIMVILMGTTGTGKSTFIKLLTEDNEIRIGHRPESETFNIQTAHYNEEGRRITLVDMPGFDDSRDGITDTVIFEKIVRFLEPESGKRRKLNGIIYMHRISDPRVGGLARKNIRVLEVLCGKKGLRNVRIVTTNWDRVKEQEGNQRENDLKRGAFQTLLAAGAEMYRHTNTIESAKQIMSNFTNLTPVMMQIQEELQEGRTLAETSAGMVLTAEMRAMQKKHEKELADLKRELEEAANAHDDALRAELEQERRAVEDNMARMGVDEKRLGRTLEQAHTDLAAEQKQRTEVYEIATQDPAMLYSRLQQAEKEIGQLREQLEGSKNTRQDLEVLKEEYQKAASDANTQRAQQEHPEMVSETARKNALGRERKSQRYPEAARQAQPKTEKRARKIGTQRKRCAGQGGFGQFFRNMGSFAGGCADTGYKHLGIVGGLVGGLAGLTASPVVASWLAVHGCSRC